MKSDHKPLLLKGNPEGPLVRTNRPFRFMANWLTDPSFLSMVKEAWEDNVDWDEAVSEFQNKAKEWNYTHFGNIFHKKRRLMARLEGINSQLSMNANVYLKKLQKTLWKDYQNILAQEELVWFQKARCNWFQFGDRNTRFYHTVTVIRRKRNKIEALQDEHENLVTDPLELSIMAREFFRNLYQVSSPMVPFSTSSAFPPLSEDQRRSLLRLCSKEEIKHVIFQMGPFKSPGKDGLHPVFYQRHWDTIGDSVCARVQDIWIHPEKVQSLNETLLVLIPKIDSPVSMKNFRPISLCNVSYKVITKMIANKLKGFLQNLIEPSQCSFIPGRHSSDNIVIAQEIFHTMRIMKGRKGFMAIKVDLEKAYDRLSWDFLLETLKLLGGQR